MSLSNTLRPFFIWFSPLATSSSPLPAFHPQFPLRLPDEVKFRHIRNRDRAVDIHGLLCLVDDHLESALRHATIFAEDAPGGFVGIGRCLAVRLSPVHHDLYGAVAILAHVAVGANPGFDHPLYFVRFLAKLFRGGSDTGKRESKKLIGPRQHVKA